MKQCFSHFWVVTKQTDALDDMEAACVFRHLHRPLRVSSSNTAKEVNVIAY